MLYLLAHGADSLYTMKEMTILDYAKQRDEDTMINKIDTLFISERREKENDNSKIFDSIQNYLSLQQQSTVFRAL